MDCKQKYLISEKWREKSEPGPPSRPLPCSHHILSPVRIVITNTKLLLPLFTSTVTLGSFSILPPPLHSFSCMHLFPMRLPSRLQPRTATAALQAYRSRCACTPASSACRQVQGARLVSSDVDAHILPVPAWKDRGVRLIMPPSFLSLPPPGTVLLMLSVARTKEEGEGEGRGR